MTLAERLFWILLVIVAYGYVSKYDPIDHLIVNEVVERINAAPQANKGSGDGSPVPSPAVAAPLQHPLDYSATVKQLGKVRFYAPPPRERNF